MTYDLIIRDGLIVDGTGSDPIRGDVAVKGDRIELVGDVAGAARHEMNVGGAVIAPGFIDVHTHDDRLLLIDPLVRAKVSQGVTTVVTGNCGISLAPVFRNGPPPPPLTLLGGADAFRFDRFGAYLDDLEARGSAVNVVPFVGHTSLRASTMVELDRPADERAVAAMLDLLEEAMRAGAAGLTTGLYYPPASAATAAEVEALLRRVSEHGGLTTSHIRNEGSGLVEALQEALSTARAAAVPLVISHLKCAAPEMWGRSGKILALLDAAAKTQDIAFDVYPYDASSTMLLPDHLQGAKRVVVSWSEPHPDKAGQDLSDIAACWCCSPAAAAARLSPGGAIYFKMQEGDMRRILEHPRAMVGSDGLPHDVHPHPRLWGTFARVLGRYVRDMQLLPLNEAIRKMTLLPAQVFGLADRGVLAPGAKADITVFDADIVIDRATYERPRQESLGIEAVLVNGELVWDGKVVTGRLGGRVLRRSGRAPVGR